MKKILLAICVCLLLGGATEVVRTLQADPCGMVPPIYTGPGVPIVRTGLQQTYVFYKDGIETFAIKPGFQGRVEDFGMLIPFPSPPSLRKIPDTTFQQIDNAIDPPEVVVDLRMRDWAGRGFGGGALPEAAPMQFAQRRSDKVTVLKQEAVGMYEVAVLAAGSAKALKTWMDQNKYQYPKGMDKVTEEYIDIGWCFVAVKTKVGSKAEADPRPGQRDVDPKRPANTVFDGTVQGMGFRFATDKLVVPMRLSAFNGGDMRNVVYLLADSPKRIRHIPEEYVVRQISGKQLVENMTQPLPLRIIGGTEKDIPDYRRQTLKQERDPGPKNGVAKALFSSDLLAVSSGNMSLEIEEAEKGMLAIGEHFGLRGADYDATIEAVQQKQTAEITDGSLADLNEMTLTVVDGDFPRQVVAEQNLTFSDYSMPAARNNRMGYDAGLHQPGNEREGLLITRAEIDFDRIDQLHREKAQIARTTQTWIIAFVGLMVGMVLTSRLRTQHKSTETN